MDQKEEKQQIRLDQRGEHSGTRYTTEETVNMIGKLQIKRVYEAESEDDGYRILVDRLWPRGMSKVRADLSDWDKQIAPTPALRKSFHDGEMDYADFREAYDKELAENPGYAELVELVEDKLRDGNVTLLFASKDETENNAEVLLELLEKSLADRHGCGSGK